MSLGDGGGVGERGRGEWGKPGVERLWGLGMREGGTGEGGERRSFWGVCLLFLYNRILCSNISDMSVPLCYTHH